MTHAVISRIFYKMSYYRVQRTDNLTPILVIIGLNLVVFIMVRINYAFLASLAFVPANLFLQPWTIVTSMFTHYTFGHILFNMLALYFFGRFLMGLLGQNNLLLIYFVGGLAGNLLCFFPNPSIAVIGASGAIYALMGALLILRPQLKVIIFPIFIPLPLWVATLIGLAIGLMPGLNIAWQAHLGGLIVGLLAGLLLRKRANIVF